MCNLNQHNPTPPPAEEEPPSEEQSTCDHGGIRGGDRQEVVAANRSIRQCFCSPSLSWRGKRCNRRRKTEGAARGETAGDEAVG